MADKHTACPVCWGKSGFKIKVDFWYEKSWQDCLFCNGLGFIEKQESNNISYLLAYNGYKKIITDVMESFGTIISYKTMNRAETIEIEYLPDDKPRFQDFARRLLKFGHYNKNLSVEIQQVFFYEPSIGKLNYYWRIQLKPDDLKDLDGFVDFIREQEN